MWGQAQISEEHEALKSMSFTSFWPSQWRSGQSSIPQKCGHGENMSSASPAPPPRLSILPDCLFLPSASATPRFSRDPPLVGISYRQIQVRATENFGVALDEDQILEEEQLFLAKRVSSEKPELTGSNVRDRKILQSSGWISEGETKFVRYVSHLSMTRLSPLTSDPVSCEGSQVCILSGPILAKI